MRLMKHQDSPSMILRLSFARVHKWGSTTVFDYSPEAGSSYRWFTPRTEGSAGTSSLPVEILGVQAATLDGRTVNVLHNDQVGVGTGGRRFERCKN
ncbi:hypothetical protein E4U35_006934 [Claviceps purpurea]|nr:hypothetical protein E4U35_006934 [Claviceps purpurea]KAG6228053.1 hypothetical protein E4U25_007726 [Claviceps purpurea]